MAYYTRRASYGRRRPQRRGSIAFASRSMYRPRFRARARGPVRRRAYTRPPRARRTTQGSAGECHCPGEISSAQKFILAQADPFDTKCFGAKIPDSSTLPSVSLVDTETQALTLVTTSNAKCYAFLPQYTVAGVEATELNPVQWSWPAAFAGSFNRGKRTNYVASYELDRPVAHAVRISSSVAPTTATGFVHVAIDFQSNLGETTWSWPTTPSAMSGCQFYRRVTLASLTQSPLTIINKFTDETAWRYQSANSAATVAQLTGTANSFQIMGSRSWGALLVAFEGTGSTNPLNVEHILLTESIPTTGSIITGTTAAPSQPSILAGAGHMSATADFAHTEDQQPSYINQALNAAAAGVAAAGDVVMSEALLPMAQQAGYAAAMTAATLGVQAIGRGISGVNADPNRLAFM